MAAGHSRRYHRESTWFDSTGLSRRGIPHVAVAHAGYASTDSHLQQRVWPAGRLLDVEGDVIDRRAARGAAGIFAAMRVAVHHRAHLEAVDGLGEPRGA